jgi:cytochrome c
LLFLTHGLYRKFGEFIPTDSIQCRASANPTQGWNIPATCQVVHPGTLIQSQIKRTGFAHQVFCTLNENLHPPSTITGESSTMNIQVKLLLSTAFFGSVTLAHANGDIERGQQLYKNRCAACHSLDYNGVGPAHKGLFGRMAGKASSFTYSAALKSSKVVWTEQTLNLWLTDPEKLIPGQAMGISFPDAAQRADLIAYMKKATPPK